MLFYYVMLTERILNRFRTPRNRNGIVRFPKIHTPAWYHEENPCQVEQFPCTEWSFHSESCHGPPVKQRSMENHILDGNLEDHKVDPMF